MCDSINYFSQRRCKTEPILLWLCILANKCIKRLMFINPWFSVYCSVCKILKRSTDNHRWKKGEKKKFLKWYCFICDDLYWYGFQIVFPSLLLSKEFNIPSISNKIHNSFHLYKFNIDNLLIKLTRFENHTMTCQMCFGWRPENNYLNWHHTRESQSQSKVKFMRWLKKLLSCCS